MRRADSLTSRQEGGEVTNTHKGRKDKADEKADPAFFFSYVIQFEDDGSFYVGSTNAPAAQGRIHFTTDDDYHWHDDAKVRLHPRRIR